MKPSRKLIITLFLLVICVIIHFYSADETRVETGYSSHFSPAFSRFLRLGFGNIPFSVGDILYGLLIGWFLWRLFSRIARVIRRKKSPAARSFKRRSLSILFFCCSVYIIFNIFWGINYNRKGIASQLGLYNQKYNREDLAEMNCLLIDKVNESKRILVKHNEPYPSNKELFSRVQHAYAAAAMVHPFLQYAPASIKSSLWGWLGNYTGFTGYYNPFTGEAQVNTTVPKFLQPFIACHEVAHQVGYAKEMEANFVGYLAAAASEDTLLHYSCYLDLFLYTNRNLYLLDSNAAKLYRHDLSDAVQVDLMEWYKFNKSHQSWAEPVIRWLYAKYLQSNRQPQGILAYDEVTAFIIAYYKKFGRI